LFLNEYLAALRQQIERLDTYGFAESINFHEELRAGKQAIVKAKIVLIDGSVLFIREYIDAKYRIAKVSYAYQYGSITRFSKIIYEINRK